MSLICIFGNSHLGALAQSANGINRLEAAGHQVVFWGIAGSNFEKIAYDRGQVVSPMPQQSLRISGGRFESLDPSLPDVTVFYGFNVGPSYLSRSIAVALQKTKNISSGLRDAIIDQEIRRMWSQEIACVLISQITSAYPEKRYLFAPQPLVAQHDEFLDRVKDNNVLFEIQTRLLRYIEDWMTDRNIQYFSQPEDTISDRFFTKPAYTKGSVRLASAEEHDVGDVNHMNPEYGNIMLAKIQRLLG